MRQTQKESPTKRAGSEDEKHTSGGVFVATDIGKGLGAVIDKARAVKSIPGNEARIAQAWIDVRGCLRVFDVYTWYPQGWTARNEALMEAMVKQSVATRHPWFVACDAHMDPGIFQQGRWYKEGACAL